MRDVKEIGLVLSRIVKIGKVTDVSGEKVRVYFDKSGMTSGWLPVLRQKYKVKYKDKYIPDTSTGSGSEVIVDREAYADFIMPSINDNVVVLYLPYADSDGFVIGGLPQ